MNEKIPIKQLSLKLAAHAGCTDTDAESFIKKFFTLIAEKLHNGDDVTIKGLGRFTLSGSTSEPVAFIPDDELANRINAPFAIFEPEILNDSVTTQMLDDVDSEAQIVDSADESTCSDVVENVEPKSEAADVVSNLETIETDTVKELEEMPLMEVSESEVPVTEIGEVSVVVDDELPNDDSTEKRVDETPLHSAVEVQQMDVTPVDDSTIEENESSNDVDKAVDESVVVEVEHSTTPTPPEPPHIDTTPPVVDSPVTAEAESMPVVSAEPAITTEDAGNHMKWFFLGLVVGLAIGALALAGYAIYYVNS